MHVTHVENKMKNASVVLDYQNQIKSLFLNRQWSKVFGNFHLPFFYQSYLKYVV